MSNKQLENVNFEIIRYANCWEDADVLLKGLAPEKGAHIMSIASAGDNCFSLLTSSPEKVIAVDISQPQLFLVELKRAAIQAFDRSTYCRFAGFEGCDNRTELYQFIVPYLSQGCKNYWDHHANEINNGIIHNGKFERYFQLFKREYLHTVHSQEIIDQLFTKKKDEAQKEFHDTHWHTEPWKKLYRFFFGEQMMGSQGRDPEFLKHVQGSVPDMILEQEAKHLRRALVQKNYFLYYILNNQFHPDFLPHYVRAENYDRIRQNLDKLILHQGLLDSALDIHPNCTHFNLSDIFEYMDLDIFKTVSSQLIRKSAPSAKFAYWNLMIPREMSAIFPDQIQANHVLSSQLTNEDLGYFYRSFQIDQRR